MTALRLWRDDESYWEGDEQDRATPTLLREPLREAVDGPVSRADFLLLMWTVPRRDREWLLGHGLLRSPHRDTDEARLGLAHARGRQALLEFFASYARRDNAPRGSSRSWTVGRWNSIPKS